MFKNNSLYALTALFALLSATIQADMFDVVRPPEQRAVPGGEKRPTAFPGLVEEETESGSEVRVEPLEWLTGGRRSDNRNRHYNDYE